jgi:hypothetical protein
MKLIPTVATLLLAFSLTSLHAADKDGFVSLFNGKDLKGWRMGPDGSWVVENGVITLKRANFDSKEHNSDYLWAEQPYGNFIVEVEVKFPEKANSGIYLRTSATNNPVPTGIEVQVINSYGKPDLHIRSTAGAIYDCQTPSKNAVKPAGEWNKYQITCRDNRIQVVLNGQQVVDMDLNRWTEAGKNPDGTKNKFPKALKDFARVGHFGFQDHGVPVWYRNVRIKKLD